jgi:hypothetical protein
MAKTLTHRVVIFAILAVSTSYYTGRAAQRTLCLSDGYGLSHLVATD